MKYTTKFLLVLMLSCLCRQAIASDFSVGCPAPNEPDYGCWIYMRGPIVEGDAKKLLQKISLKPKTSDIYRYLVLDSHGGDVLEALELAKVVRDSMLETRNYPARPYPRRVEEIKKSDLIGYVCASACVIVSMAGANRTFRTFGGGGLGLHRPYLGETYKTASLPPSKIAEMQSQAMRTVRDFLVSEQMPARLIDEMMNRSSKEIYWVSMEESFGIPQTSPWFEEMLIAQCNHNPSLEMQVLQAGIIKNKVVYETGLKELGRVGACSRALIEAAQIKLRLSVR